MNTSAHKPNKSFHISNKRAHWIELRSNLIRSNKTNEIQKASHVVLWYYNLSCFNVTSTLYNRERDEPTHKLKEHSSSMFRESLSSFKHLGPHVENKEAEEREKNHVHDVVVATSYDAQVQFPYVVLHPRLRSNQCHLLSPTKNTKTKTPLKHLASYRVSL